MCQVVVPNDHGKGHTREQNVPYFDQGSFPNELLQLDLFDGYFQSLPVLNNNGNEFGSYVGQLPQYDGNQGYINNTNNLNVVMGVPNPSPQVQLYPAQQRQEQMVAPRAAKEAVSKPGKPPVGKKRSRKSPEEIAAQVERVKQRRRESAQRSRNRKCEYVKNLEEENAKLKNENEYLKQLLSQKQSIDSGKEVATGIRSDSVISRVGGNEVKQEPASSSASLTPSLEDLMDMNETIPGLSDILGIAV